MTAEPTPPTQAAPGLVPSIDSSLQMAPDKIQLKDMTHSQLGEYLAGIGERSFRTEQIFNWMYVRRVTTFAEMSNLPKSLRQRLDETCSLHRIVPHEIHDSPDGTCKLTFKCHDGAIIESVWIPNARRNTLCISSQVGCAMGCTFCLTAKMGLVRNLSVGEIIDQVVHTKRMFEDEDRGRLSNIVMMGMGEPLHNYMAAVEGMRLMTDGKGLGLSNRKVTVSTSGLVPALEKLGDDITVNLAVSLNATTDELRDEIMPINKRWPLAVLLETLRNFPLKQRRRITIEYVLLAGLNDSLEDAARMIKLLRDIPCKINLIPWNAHPDSPFKTPGREKIVAFQKYLIDRNFNALIRETRGVEAMAACGQLGKPGDRLPKRFRKAATA